MEFRCEDLREAGILLVPSTSPEYDPLLADIQRRIDPEKRSTSAILLNQSGKTIEDIRGWVYRSATVKTHPTWLTPPSLLKIMTYWMTIMPRSMRHLGENGLAGDNADVRPPVPDEIRERGVYLGAGGRVA